jgi:hypothetical protein
MVPKRAFLRTLTLASALTCLFLPGQPTLTQAGCGCDKPPPVLAEIRPNATYAETEVTLFHPDLQSGQDYTVTFTSGTTGESVFVETQALTRRGLADGQYKPQVVVPLPDMPLGPTSISVSLSGQSGALMAVTDDAFTVVPQPVVLPEEVGESSLSDFQAAVSRDGVVYLSLDVSAMQLPRTFKAQAQGYPLRFIGEDVVFYNTQGFLMQILDGSIPGLFSFKPATAKDQDSDILHYSRHEFNTFYLQHAERQPHEVDPQDPNWHLDGTAHIDHDHLIVAISGYLNNGFLPESGETPPFELVLNTFTLFHHGLFGDTSVFMDRNTITGSYNSKDGIYGSEGDVLSNGEIKLTSWATINGDATAFAFDITGNAAVVGEMILATEPTEFMPVDTPDSLVDLGSIDIQKKDVPQTLGPGSYEVAYIDIRDNNLFIDNTAGPVTLYITEGQKHGNTTIALNLSKTGSITVYDPNPEKFAIYVTDGDVTIENDATFYGTVYAPGSYVEIGGEGKFFGAFVGKEVKLSGDAIVHYDPALRGE